MPWFVRGSAFIVLTAMMALSSPVPAQGLATTPLRQSFDLQVLWPPIPVAIAGKLQLVYELHLTNFARVDLALRRIQLLDSASGSIVGDFRESELQGLIGRIDHSASAMEKLLIPSGVRAVAYLALPIQSSGAAGRALTHRIEYEVRSEVPELAVVEGGAFRIRDEPRLSLGPPLRGGSWAAIYNATWERGHRRVLFAVQGSVHIPGRFAIDWIKVERNGKYFDRDGSRVADWYGYGAEVLAVADSIVATTRDGVAESSVVAENPTRTSPDGAAGNYIALNLGGGWYAFYEHLKPGSIQVKPGDRVQRGRVIGLLGYTGESTGPHLHFHVSDGNAALNAEGVPYRLQDFRILGTYPSVEAFAQSRPWEPLAAGVDAERSGEFPAPFTVVEFSSK